MSYFRNVQNNGVWELGETYTFEVFYQATNDFIKSLISDDGVALTDDESYAFSDNYNLTRVVDEEGSNWEWKDDCIKGASGVGLEGRGAIQVSEGSLETGYWLRYTVRVNSDMPSDSYKLLHIHYTKDLGWPDYVLEDVEEYEITVGTPAPSDLFWPEDRPDDYDPDKEWEYAWVTGGGRYKNHLIAVGYDSNGIGIIYFGDG